MLARGRSGCQASAWPAAWYHSVLVPKRSRSKAWLVVVLLVLLAAIGSVSYLGWRQSVRGVVSVTTPPRFVGHKTAFVFTLEAARGNVARVEIRIIQGGSSSVVAKQEGTFGQRVEVPFVLESATLGLREGSASLEVWARSEEHTSELQSPCNLVCRLLLEKKKNRTRTKTSKTNKPQGRQ